MNFSFPTPWARIPFPPFQNGFAPGKSGNGYAFGRNALLILMASFPLTAPAQRLTQAAQSGAIPFSDPRWAFIGKQASAAYLGKKGLKLIREKEDAYAATIAFLEGFSFGDGVIEVDMATPFSKETMAVPPDPSDFGWATRRRAILPISK